MPCLKIIVRGHVFWLLIAVFVKSTSLVAKIIFVNL